MAEDEVTREYHQLNGHESKETLRDRKGPGAWRVAVHGVAKSQT